MKKILFLTAIILLLTGCGLINRPTTSIPANQQPSNINQSAGNKLDLSGSHLTALPKYVLGMTNLEELNLSNNQLTGSLPAEIRQLKNLRTLNISNNQMTGLPAEVGQLQNLQTLDLSNNQLTGLPYELGNLKNLKMLNLSGNKYSEQDLNTIIKGLPVNVVIIK